LTVKLCFWSICEKCG